MTRKQFNAREFERELVDAGYMPLYEYIRRWGNEGEVLSSRARFAMLPNGVIDLHRSEWTDLDPFIAESQANARSSENN